MLNRGWLSHRLWHEGDQFLKAPYMVGDARFHCRRTLCARLSGHSAKIRARRNITLDDMKCRYLTFASEW